jgi:hypothetical protein
MLERFLANCICVVSLSTLLWGVSPLFAGDTCIINGCASGDQTCLNVQDPEGECPTSLTPCVGLFTSNCQCKTVTINIAKHCRCRTR